jgi:hypothetical protein
LELEYLYLQFNTFTGPLPTALFDTWSNLRHFNIQNNDFVANLSHTIITTNHKSQLTHAWWTSNTGIVGTFPAALGHCWTNLVLLDVYGCALYGTLPESIGHWTNMEHADFLYNELSGSLPASLYRWTNVKTAAFFHNNFTGTIPSYLSTWTQLDSILLDQNLFTGTLPSSLGALSATLTGFSVSSNRLSGTIPESYGAWTNIVQASFEGNNFTGSMPDGLCQIVNASILAMAHATEQNPNPVMIQADCVSEVHCPCCTYCSEDAGNIVY